MKTMTQMIMMVALAAWMITGILHGAVPDEDPPRTETVNGTGWQQNACIKKKVYTDPVDVSLDVSADLTKKVGASLTISTSVTILDCCGSCQDEHAWCNFDGDDERC